MKKLIYLGFAIFLMAGMTTAQSQILKKLKKQVERSVEGAVTKKVSDKAADETEKAMNNLWAKQIDKSYFTMGMDMVDPEEIPAIYEFDWEYTLNMKTTEGDMNMIYHIRENAPYIGIKIPQAENMFTVLDNSKDMTVLYMDSEGSKMVMATRNNISEEYMEPENPYGDMEFEEIGTKTILGYECRGYRSENADHVLEFYVTEKAGISFRDLYQDNQKNVPKGLDADWLKDGNGLMMEMQMTDKKDPKKNVSITCIGIEKKPFAIKTSEYQSISGDR